jgi:hypothetical protein
LYLLGNESNGPEKRKSDVGKILKADGDRRERERDEGRMMDSKGGNQKFVADEADEKRAPSKRKTRKENAVSET